MHSYINFFTVLFLVKVCIKCPTFTSSGRSTLFLIGVRIYDGSMVQLSEFHYKCFYQEEIWTYTMAQMSEFYYF